MLPLNKERVRDYLVKLRQKKAIISCGGRYYYVELCVINNNFHNPENYIMQEELPLTTLSVDFLSITPNMYF